MQIAVAAPARRFARLRARELERLDRHGQVYLDYTGAAPYPASLIREHHRLLSDQLFGNPHSTNPASLRSNDAAESARHALLSFLDADADEYDVVWTANASAALRLVGEAFPFDAGNRIVLAADNHNSAVGLREYARARGASIEMLPVDPELRLSRLPEPGAGLLVLPAQSNFSGVQHPLGLIADAQTRGFTVLLDAASFVPTNPLSLRSVNPDFVALSFYKMFGFPSGLGALIARKSALSRLRRPAFAGGTVEFASILVDRYKLEPGARAFEDGTINFLAIPAVSCGLAFLQRVAHGAIQSHVSRLTGRLLEGLVSLRHPNGTATIRIYGPRSMTQRGGTIAFNLIAPNGMVVPHERVVDAAAANGISLRGGCFCNPGAAERAFDYGESELRRALERVHPDFSHDALRAALNGKAVGAVRASLGYGSNFHDVDALVEFLARFRFNEQTGEPS
jgi:selenocysteine lyase/cysteine desulfurase